MKFFDRASFSTRRITDEGFLLATAKVGRPGVQTYFKGIDFNDDELPLNYRSRPFGSPILLLRPESEVFNPESMKTFEHKPVTNDHPKSKVVDSSNVKDEQVGFSRKVKRVNDVLESDLLIQDKTTIEDVDKGKDQISLGYDADIRFEQGTHKVYGPYDAIMTNIVGNHIAIVDRARAGDQFRLQDKKSELKGTKKMGKIRVVDGISVELSDDAATIFDNWKAKLGAQASEIKTLKAQVADAKAETEKVKGELDATKAKTVNDEDVQKRIDERVEARIKLVDTASKVISDADFVGKSNKEIKLEVIKTLGDSKVEIPENASDEWIGAAFNTLIATAKPKSQKMADALVGDKKPTADKAREEMMKRRGSKQTK